MLVRRAIGLLGPEPGDRIADFFCGLGNFTLPIARRGAAVIGVLLGLEMMRRVDASAIDDQTAVAALRGAVGAPQLMKETTA